MKWKNIDVGPAYYFITATITEWLPLLSRDDIRKMVCDDIMAACEACGASIAAYVIMPDHLHLLVALPEKDLLHKFCKLWRGRSGRHIPRVLEKQGDNDALKVLARHANGGCRYAVWKEQVRALAVWTRPKLYTVVNYIHSNPVRRGLVENPADWQHSSCGFYESGAAVDLAVVSIEP